MLKSYSIHWLQLREDTKEKPGRQHMSLSGIRLQCERLGFDPWVGKIPWRRAWQPTPVFLPGES